MSPWDPLAEKFAAIWQVLQALTADVAELKRAVFGPPMQDPDPDTTEQGR